MAYSEISRGDRVRFGLMVLAALALSACGGGGDGEGNGPEAGGGERFETAWPGADGSRGDVSEDAATGAPGAAQAGDGANFANDDGGEAARVIQEADIIQVDGDRLYALSRMSGLNVVDISDHTDLKVVGTFANTRDAEPFEMYIEGEVALVMFSGWGDYVWVEEADGDGGGGYSWVQSSQVVALDVADPTAIAELGSFNVPGSISDSRIVGEVLYVVGYEDGYCWDCAADEPRTSVVSLDVSDPRAISKVDELYFNDASNEWGWGRRSVTVTTERMYVAGIEEGGTGEPQGSTIQVVDITDPEGDMVLGAEVEAAGQINSRWQMDEHEGVLRVISQPPEWRLTEPPVIQTFTIVSSAEVTPLGSANMRLPRPEQLQSVRFDGERAYAITFERTDPLFTIDLSDPANPRQVGELEIPGFVYHMEPRGDRVIGLGFDQGSAEGSITVSLFDVSVFEAPTMIARVNFGGDWAYLPEDQNRIHKVFRVLDELGLIMVPHSGYHEPDFIEEEGRFIEECYRGGYDSSHVQLVDFTLDTLTLQGSMPTRGEARRALVHGGDVLTVSDQQVDAFDISDRSAPELLGGVALARNVSRALPMDNGVIARVTSDWWSDDFSIDFVTAGEAHLPSAGVGELSLSAEIAGEDECGYFWTQDVITDGEHVMVFYEREDWKSDEYKQSHGVIVVDAGDPAAPQVIGKSEWNLDGNWWGYGGQWAHGIPVDGRHVTAFDGGAAILESGWFEDSRDRGHEEFRVRVIDLRDPSAPEAHVVELPSRNGYFALRASGDTLVTSHFESVEGSSALARFYLDRIDVRDPGAPELLAPINVPGVVMHYDAEDGYAVTMDLQRQEAGELDWDACAERFATFDFEWDDRGNDGTCVGYGQIVRLTRISGSGATLLDSHAMGEQEALRRIEVAGDVLVGTTGRGDYYGGYGVGVAIADCFGPCGGYYYDVPEPEQLLVLSGMTDGELRTGTLELERSSDPWAGWWGASSLVADGDRALVTSEGELAIIDLSNPLEPMLDRVEPFAGYTSHVAVRDGRVALALGEKGCRVIDM